MQSPTMSRFASLAAIALLFTCSVAEAALSPPASISATAISTSEIEISWTDPNAGETAFGLERSLSPTSGFVQIAKLGKNVTTFLSTGLSASTTYYFRVRSFGRKGRVSGYSPVASATTFAPAPSTGDTTAPSTPTGLGAVAASCSQVNLSWTASTDTGGSGLKGYNVYRNGTLVKQVTTTSTSDSGLSASTSYSYAVSAIDNAGNQSAPSAPASATTPSCPDTTAPSVPTGLSVTAASCTEMSLSWNASADAGGSGLKGYNVYRDGLFLEQVTTTSTTDSGLSDSTSYSYSVSAVDNAGNESAEGATSTATTPACADTTAPSTPTGLSATAASCNQVNLAWTTSTDTGGSGLKGYNVYRNGSFVKQVTTTSTSDSVPASSSSSYSVAAVDNSGNQSGQSASASATTPACPDAIAPSVPSGVSATAASCSQVNLSWSASTDTGGSGLEGYNVYRNGSFVKQVTTTSTSDTGLAASTSYSYKVSAIDNAGNQSAQSTAASATTPACPDTTTPSVPSGVSATAASCGQVNLSWSASTDTGGSGLKGYNVYRSGSFVKQVTTTSTSDAGLAASTIYSYAVSAIDNAGNQSAQSAAASVNTPACNQPPVANAGPDQSATVGTEISFSGAASSDPDGSIASYSWSFGDGATANGANATHAFASGGTYTAALTVTDNAGASATDTALVTVSASSGSSAWSKRFGDTGADLGRAVAADLAGNRFLAGSFAGSVDFGGGALSSAGGADIFLAKYSGSGSHVWSKRFGSASDDVAYGVAVDGSGNVVITGYFQGSVDFGGGMLTSAGGYEIFVAKFSSSGAHLWSKRFGSTSSEIGYAIAANAGGKIAVTGYFQGSVDFGGGARSSTYGGMDTFVACFSADGVHLWSKNFVAPSPDIGYAVAIDANDDVLAAGAFQGTSNFGGGTLASAGSYDAFLTKLSSTGAHLWSKRFGGTTADYANGVAVDSSSSAVVTGSFQATADFGGGPLTSAGSPDIFVARYGSDGSHLWSKRLGSASTDIGYAVAVDGSDNLLVTGFFQGSTDFGGGALASAGFEDVFAVKYSPDGAHLWSRRFGSASTEYGYGAAMAPDGYAVLTGFFYGTVDFGHGPRASAGAQDAFLLSVQP